MHITHYHGLDLAFAVHWPETLKFPLLDNAHFAGVNNERTVGIIREAFLAIPSETKRPLIQRDDHITITTALLSMPDTANRGCTRGLNFNTKLAQHIKNRCIKVLDAMA